MLPYFLKRFGLSLLTLLGISLLIFTLLTLAPGNPLGELATNPNITETVRENLRRSLGLDQPLPVRYVKWFLSLCRGDFGYSFTSRSPVLDLILQRLPTTLSIMGIAYFLSILMALPMGIMAALKRQQWLDYGLSSLSIIGFSLPPFLTGLTLIIVFSVQLKWLPFIYDSTLQVNSLQTLVEQFQQSILPILVLTLYQSAILFRFVRSAVLEELPQDYIRTAYAKGLKNGGVIKNHLLRNALIPVVTLIALDLPTIFTGALVTEQIFRVPGIGALMIESIYRNDTPVVMAVTFLYAVLIVLFGAIADGIYGLLDPRVKLN
ncbi:MAG: ABC transporter permease [Microcystaceae cyanobacterium]